MFVIYNGRPLIVDGRLATSLDCCCTTATGCECRTPPDVSETFNFVSSNASCALCDINKPLSWYPAQGFWYWHAAICYVSPPEYDYWVIDLKCIGTVWELAVSLTWKGSLYQAEILQFDCAQDSPVILTGSCTFTGLPTDFCGSSTLSFDFTVTEQV